MMNTLEPMTARTRVTENGNSILDCKFLTMRQAAELFHVSRKTIYDWRRKGRLRTVRIAGTVERILESDLAAVVKSDAR